MNDALKDILLDIVQHTHNLGVIDLIKVIGTDKETTIGAVGNERSLVMDAVFHKPIAEFIGTFGMPNLNKLNIILGIPEYRENAVMKVSYQNSDPSGIDFTNQDGDFKNNYRFMDAKTVSSKVPTVSLRSAIQWDVELEPTVASIQRLKFQSQAHSDELTFTAKTNNDRLEVSFGTASTHAGNFIFAQNVSGKLSSDRDWPVAIFLSILNLPGDKRLRFSDKQGLAEITVDSGIAMYNYKIPALTK
jgi:hypothetical protein